ncbi:TetR/AcrR family transcriptional regulator [Nocardiopsis sp. HNM0947]|uniref:TetR/AcrR family transcriptional regulator n=1 Tax=Nocardiopsis coralli TaxID=2772213 RepID=A0ABR9PAF9_9ACTN|nr:helix-turn-helix domain-containing protein [Nocardiopsis coralli]MBE3000812.1 TetR/AcrR family transcriptional regulator [Nocardiopsis coralli]
MPRELTSTAEARKATVVASAIHVFAASGYLGTPISAVAEHAGISPAYVFKLFPGKKQLFVAALDRCFELIREALAEGAEAAASGEAEDVLDAMGGAYAALIADRDLLMLQVHALSAADVPEIGEAMRRGMAETTRFASSRSGGSARQVQRFIATGQLCHLVTTLELDRVDQSWARTLDMDIRHAAPDRTDGGESG